ncbi:MAG TPA: aminopeptidase P family protein [Thermoanaerobaculia bacterium]|nr:aminopeptidase P family protein [Thermoanaerobaculia bacterium]
MNREESLERRRAAAAAAWNLDHEIVLIGAGEPVPIPGRGDQTYPFRAHSEYFYLAGHERPGSVLAFDPGQGWTDFVPEVTEKEKIWAGELTAAGTPLCELEPWLRARLGRTIALLGSAQPLLPAFPAYDQKLGERLREGLLQVRRPKEEAELVLLRQAARATAAGFAALRGLIRPGVTERQLQIELEAEFFRAGATRAAYDTIVGSGPNAAVFHVSPSARVLQAGELVLVDAGAECDNYACDVTRTYPVDGGFSAEQRDLYAIVLEAERAAIDRCRAGTEWKEIHLGAARQMAAGLVDFGLLRGDPHALVEQGACALFFPHGIGHMVGLGVRDASGRLPGREPDRRPGLENLRVDLPLAAGYVMTIEPGLYFVPALLQDAGRREKFRAQVDWERADRLLGMGGVRIEDNVLVTAGAPLVLTADIPKDL